MNKQMTRAEIDRLWFTDGGARTNVRFTGLDQFDTLLGPHEDSTPCPGIGAWAASLVKVKAGPRPPSTIPAAIALASVTMK